MGAELLDAIVSWQTFVVALLVFGFAPGALLRLIVLVFRRDDPRRSELLAELHAVPRLERPFWVVEQLEVVLFEGIWNRRLREGSRRAVGLDQRPNLMELKPGEFESLITNLFTKIGLATRMTQPSRDGGVNCVAYDSRAIFGGKVIIQVKRYKNTVPVSAVRDLFGSVHNEGATKGILVTTSGFGKASFDFANDKPLELLSGTNLLYLLKEHAGMNAKIEPPEH